MPSHFPLGRGREGWGDSRLSPAPKNITRSLRQDFPTGAFVKFATCPFPQERSERISLSGTVSTSLTVPAPQTRKEANKLSGTAPTILTSPRVSEYLRQDLYCGTVPTRKFSKLHDQKEALSKLEAFMRQENIKEDSNIRTVPDNFDFSR